MIALLRAGALDAVIVGNELPEGDDLRTVFPDPAAAGDTFFARHGFVPVNHLLSVRADVAREPGVRDALVALFRRLKAAQPPAARDVRPIGRASLDPAASLAIRYCLSQGLLKRAPTLDEVWAA
jgi:4,5-dihydroxyphthalate decarboxylase